MRLTKKAPLSGVYMGMSSPTGSIAVSSGQVRKDESSIQRASRRVDTGLNSYGLAMELTNSGLSNADCVSIHATRPWPSHKLRRPSVPVLIARVSYFPCRNLFALRITCD